MTEQYIPYLIGGAVLLVMAAIGLAIRYEKKRTEALKHQAVRMGYQFEEKSPPEIVGDPGHFFLLSKGHSKQIKNRLFGERDGVGSMLFEYRYTVGSGKNSTTYKQTVACFELKDRRIPPFSMRPENVLHRIGGLFGQQDIDFEAHPEFSKKYLLQGADEAAVRAFFNREKLGFLEQNPGWSVESDGERLLVYRAAKRVKPENLETFYTEVRRIYDIFQ